MLRQVSTRGTAWGCAAEITKLVVLLFMLEAPGLMPDLEIRFMTPIFDSDF